MPVSDDQLTELQHAYQVLGVPTNASAPAIKQTYLRLVKRWHPDLYANGTSAHAEATQMTSLINEAYAAVEHAPLRYHIESYTNQVKETNKQTSSSWANERTRGTAEKIPKTDKLEFWVRFACGGLFGVFVSLDIVMSVMPDSAVAHLPLLALGVLGVVLGSGLAAARYGDKFWYSIFRHWWLWP